MVSFFIFFMIQFEEDIKERINDITCPVCWLVRQTG